MGLLTRVEQLLFGSGAIVPAGFAAGLGPASAAAESRGQLDPGRLVVGANRTADWSMVRDPAKLAAAVRINVTVWACATLLADAVAESPLRVYRTVKGEAEEVADHRCRTVLRQPNPHMAEAEFMALLVHQMAVQGYGLVEKVRSGAGLPVQLWPLRPDWLYRDHRSAGGWFYRVPGTDPRPIPAEDLIVVPYRHDPAMERPGLSPVHVAAREIGLDVAMTDLVLAFVQSGGIPPFALEHPEKIDDPVHVEAIQAQYALKYGGSKAYEKLPLFHGGWKIVKIGVNLDELAAEQLRGLNEAKLAQGFRVPLELIQSLEATGGTGLTETQSDGAMRQLQRYGASPLRNRIDGALTRGLLHEFTGGDPTLDLAFDTGDVLALQEDEDALHARVRADYQAGIAMLNESRGAVGLPDLGPAGDVFAVPFSVTHVPAGQLTGGGDTPARSATIRERPPAGLPASRAERRYRDVRSLGPAELELRARVTGRTQRDRARLVDIGTRKLRAFFREQGERTTAGLRAGGGAAETRDAVWPLDWGEEERKLVEVLTRFYAASGEAAVAGVADTLGVALSWDLASPNVARVMGELGVRIVGIHEGTRADVARILTDGLTEGKTVDQLAGDLRGLFEETYRGRAETIARTETTYSYGRASVLGYQESGVVAEIELLDNPDHDSDPGSDGLTCAERNHLVVSFDAVDGHLTAEHPNGSIATVPVLATPLGE